MIIPSQRRFLSPYPRPYDVDATLTVGLPFGMKNQYPLRAPIGSGILMKIGNSHQVAAIDVHDEDAKIAGGPGAESDPETVWREGRLAGVLYNPPPVGAIEVGQIDVIGAAL